MLPMQEALLRSRPDLSWDRSLSTRPELESELARVLVLAVQASLSAVQQWELGSRWNTPQRLPARLQAVKRLLISGETFRQASALVEP